jgi:hypothetical protein
MARQDVSIISQQRAEDMLELELWEVINRYFNRKATDSECKLTRVSILKMLCKMCARIALELQQKKS